MKDYKEMAQKVFERRDEYLAAQKRKKLMIYKACVPVCALVLVTLSSLLLWQEKLPELPVKDPDPTIVQNQNSGNNSEENNTFDSFTGYISNQDNSAGEISAVQTESGERDHIQVPTEKVPQTDVQRPHEDKPASPENDKPVKPLDKPGDSSEQNKPPGMIVTPQTGTKPTEDTDNAVPETPLDPPFPNDPWAPPCSPEPPTFEGDSSAPPVPPTTESTVPMEPEYTGPLKITVGDETVTAQVGDKITYTVELQAAERFENIQLSLFYDSNFLNLLVPQNAFANGFADTAPNMPSGVCVGYNHNVFKINASDIYKYDFRQKKVLFTVEFIVKKPGEVLWDFKVEEMSIECFADNSSANRDYFTNGKQQIFTGIEFYHNLKIN